MTEIKKCPICWNEMEKKIFDVGTEIDMLLKETGLYSISIYWAECPRCKYKEIDYSQWAWPVIKKIRDLLGIDYYEQKIIELERKIDSIKNDKKQGKARK